MTEKRKNRILKSIEDGDEHGYDLRTVKHRHFFVEKFYETDFKKITPRAPMGTYFLIYRKSLKLNRFRIRKKLHRY